MNRSTGNAESPVVLRDWQIPEDHTSRDFFFEHRASVRTDMARWQRHIDLFWSIVQPLKGPHAHVLDVGSWDGLLALELANKGFSVTGLEIHPGMCEITDLSAKRLELDARAVQGDACAIPFDDNSFGAVMSTNFFEHVYDVDLALSEQVRVLKPKGILIIEDGNITNPKLLFHLLIRRPIRTKGIRGPLKWLFTKGKVQRDLYGFLPEGRDEDVKTVWWWRGRIEKEESLRVLDCTTTAKYQHPSVPRLMRFAIGQCLVVAEKVPL